MSQSGGPPYLTPGTEVSAKYKGAFCEAKIKRCQKSVKCKVAPRDGGPQISVTDDAVQGDLKIGGPVKVRQPDSGQIIDGNISRIIDSSIYTVVFDDGDVATLKRTQICLKGDKHYMEGDTLDKLPLTNPEHFSTPVNLMKKERRRRPGYSSNQSSVLSDDSDVDDEATSISRRISPRAASKSALDVIGKVVSVEIGDKKKWAPALVVKPSSADSDAKGKGSFTVKSFRDNKITSVTERQVREFSRDLVKTYSDDRLTKAAVDKALKYINTKELPASWKKDDLLGISELSKQASLSQSKTAASSVSAAGDSDEESDSSSDEDEEKEEKSDMFIAQLYKFMDDRSTPINKPAQLYNRDINLSRLYQKVRKCGGFNKVSASGKWKYVANKLGFSGISAGTEMKLLYRRYLVAFEEFYRKMGDTHMFEVSRSSQRTTAAGGRSVLPPRDRESHHSGAVDAKSVSGKSTRETSKLAAASTPKTTQAVSKTTQAVSKTTPAVGKSVEGKPSPLDQEVKVKQERPAFEETPRRTPVRQVSSKKEDRLRAAESPKRPESSAKGKAPPTKSSIKMEKATKLDLSEDQSDTSQAAAATLVGLVSALTPPAPPTPSSKGSQAKGKEDSTDTKADNDSVVSEDTEDSSTVSVDVDYPPGTKLRVRYGRGRNIKLYDAKVVEVRLGEDKQVLYSVHYSGWNVRYDEVISSERIVGTVGKCEKRRMDLSKESFNSRKKSKSQNPLAHSSSSTGSRTPEPTPAGKLSAAGQKSTLCKSNKTSTSSNALPSAIQPSNRTTRSSATDVTLSRPTRSRSTDSTLSSGLTSSRKVRQRRVLQNDDSKTDTTADADNGDSTEAESACGDTDVDKSEKEADSVAEVKVEVSETAVEVVDEKIKETIPSSEQAVVAEKTTRRTQRKATNKILPAITDESQSQSADSISSTGSKKVVKKTEAQATSSRPSSPMNTEIRGRMCDVIDKVAEGESNSQEADVISEETIDSELAAPPAKRSKVDVEDSTVPVGGDEEPYVKIEPLKHKKAFTSVDPEPEAKSDDVETEETEAMRLPPLIGGAGKGSVTETESSKTSRASSGVDDSELSYNSSDNEGVLAAPLVSEAAIKCEPETSGPPNVDLYKMSNSVTSNLSLLSEQASHIEPTGTQRKARGAATRRQQAKRSPRPKHAAYDQTSVSANHGISHITQQSEDCVSPAKLLRTAAPPPPPRKSKYNFKIEEELGQIVDQDERIAYLSNKLSEIRNLYTDVKSNLVSIERKRKRMRQRGREQAHHHY